MIGQIRVPYADGMTEGQGFNSYLQQTCVYDAVTVGTTGGSDTPVDITYESTEIKDYSELLQTLDISAGAGVSGWRTETKIDSKFLNRTEIKKSLLTYVVKKESSYPQGKYGDRFISDFVKGGALFARVSIITNENSTSQELKVAAKTAFKVYGANVVITSEINKAIQKIQKTSKLSDGAEDDMVRLKQVADAFYKSAPKQGYRRFALLEKYTNIPNFNNEFQPLDYTEAEDRSWAIFNAFTKCLVIQNMIRAIDSSHYISGRTGRDKLDTKVSKQRQAYRVWVNEVSKNPQKAESPPENDPETLQTEVLLAVKKKTFIAQSIVMANNLKTHCVFLVLLFHVSRACLNDLFSFEAYDFDQVMATTKVIFGKSPNGNKYICLMGRKSITPGYEQVSQLWGFEENMKNIVDGKVIVDPIVEMGVIKLDLQDATPRHDDDFSFYVKKY
ncbi:hypothetical protein V2G26_012827 [Clonostachys chloroleuca]